MKKRTHIIFAILLFIILNGFFSFPLLFVVFAIIGAALPDFDLWPRSLHRKLLHNIWALAIIVFFSLRFSLMDTSIALAFSIGFISHLISDSLTPMGIRPLWPIPTPHVKGPISTGGHREYLIAVILLFLIGYSTGIVQLRFPI